MNASVSINRTLGAGDKIEWYWPDSTFHHPELIVVRAAELKSDESGIFSESDRTFSDSSFSKSDEEEEKET